MPRTFKLGVVRLRPNRQPIPEPEGRPMTVDEHCRFCDGTEGFLIEALDQVYWTIRCDTCGEMVTANADDERMRVAAARAERHPVV